MMRTFVPALVVLSLISQSAWAANGCLPEYGKAMKVGDDAKKGEAAKSAGISLKTGLNTTVATALVVALATHGNRRVDIPRNATIGAGVGGFAGYGVSQSVRDGAENDAAEKALPGYFAYDKSRKILFQAHTRKAGTFGQA